MLRRVLLVVACAVGMGAISACTAAKAEPTPTAIPTSPAPIKPLYTVMRGEVVNQIEFSGRIAPVVEKELYFRVDGRVQNVYIERRAAVTAGQLLADLESSHSQYDIRRAEINLEIGKLRLQAVESQPSSRAQQIEEAIKTFEVELAQIALDELKADIADTQIVAPFDGQLLTMNTSEGRQVTAFTPVMVVASLDALEVSAELDADELKKLAEGMTVTLELIGRPGVKLNGSIRQLPYPYGSGGTSQEVGDPDPTVRIQLDADAAEAGYELGDLVRIQVIIERKTNTLWLPPQALRTFDQRKFVVVQDEQGQRRVDVTLGIVSKDRVEILEGLTEGQVVVGP